MQRFVASQLITTMQPGDGWIDLTLNGKTKYFRDIFLPEVRLNDLKGYIMLVVQQHGFQTDTVMCGKIN